MKQRSALASLLAAALLVGTGCAGNYGYDRPDEEFGVSPGFEEEGFEANGDLYDGVGDDEFMDSDEGILQDDTLD